MNNYAQAALNEYKNASNSAITFSDPHSLIMQMIDGALTRISQARGAIERGETANKASLISRSVLIIGSLEGCLNLEKGGSLAANLSGLYKYMTLTLTEANLKNDIGKLDEVSDLLGHIRFAWQGIPAEHRKTQP